MSQGDRTRSRLGVTQGACQSVAGSRFRVVEEHDDRATAVFEEGEDGSANQVNAVNRRLLTREPRTMARPPFPLIRLASDTRAQHFAKASHNPSHRPGRSKKNDEPPVRVIGGAEDGVSMPKSGPGHPSNLARRGVSDDAFPSSSVRGCSILRGFDRAALGGSAGSSGMRCALGTAGSRSDQASLSSNESIDGLSSCICAGFAHLRRGRAGGTRSKPHR